MTEGLLRRFDLVDLSLSGIGGVTFVTLRNSGKIANGQLLIRTHYLESL